jgi:glycosyltransferase involved in cell wall biosynthesis
LASDLEYFCGVSWPRSGHHLLVRILSAYFGERFGYCGYYSPKDCCRNVPCERAGAINLSKNHDRNSVVPILDGEKYLIQYREFCPSVVSDYELYVRNKGKDSKRRFRKFAKKELENYHTFMQRWATAESANAVYVRIAYERLTRFPVETLESTISLFAPKEPLNREKLAVSIETADQITIKDKARHVDAQKGVHASRDIRSFRHYDEEFFAMLDERSKPAYAAMIGIPAVRRFSDLYSKDGAFVRTTPSCGKEKKNKKIYVDATGMLGISGVAPTGIPRVQEFLIERTVHDNNENIRVVLFDRKLGAYRAPSEREISLLVSPRPVDPEGENPTTAKRALLFGAFNKIRENPHLGRDFERYISSKVVGPQPDAAKFLIIKNTLRGYRYYRRILGLVSRRPRSSEGAPLDVRDGVVLMSHMSIFSSQFSKSMAATEQRALVCHDLIPWLHPELVGGQRQAKRFVLNFTRLLQRGANVLCTSDTSRAMLHQFIDKIGESTVRIGRFPLPSTLYEIAGSLGRTSRLEATRPFVIYCSTIEVRKNHLLLAKIWKRALDENIALPKLVCVGKWGWGVDELRAYLQANPDLRQHIDFVGPLTDGELIDLYRSALFGVFPSRIEGWGFGASECLDFGTPVIVSTAPALQEAVGGLMPSIDVDDEEAWYAHIRLLAESTEAREDLTRKIKDRYQPVTKNESWHAVKTALGVAD